MSEYTSSEHEAARPGAVTAVAVAVWVAGALNIVTGVLLLFQLGNAELVEKFGGSVALTAFGIATAILGAVTIFIATGLLRGSNGARVVITILLVVSVGAAVFLSLAAPAFLWSAILSIVVSVIALVLLYVGRAGRFFRV